MISYSAHFSNEKKVLRPLSGGHSAVQVLRPSPSNETDAIHSYTASSTPVAGRGQFWLNTFVTA